MPKFDIIIANPPYAEKRGTSKTLHYDIAEQFLNKYNEKMIFIMPGQIVNSTSDRFSGLRKKFNMISKIEFVGNPFIDGKNGVNVVVDIFSFENHQVDNINVRGTTYNSLSDIRPFNDYESQFMSILYNEDPKYFKYNYNPRKKEKDWSRCGEKFFDDFARKLNKNGVYVLSAQANGNKLGRGYYLSSKDKNPIISGIENIKKYCKNHNVPKIFVEFDNVLEAKNYVDAIKRPLLRFGLIKMQDTQFFTKRCYQYIPDIDWSDNRTSTDEGILEMCGCEKEKANEFAEYCRKFVKNVDDNFSKK